MTDRFIPDYTIANRYKTIKELGRGGMGVVYLVEDALKDNIKFAVKTIRQDIIYIHKVTGKATFKNEYEIMTRLKHPSLTRVYDFGEDRDNYYIVMEYLTGSLLSNYKVSGEKGAIDILVQILRALEYIHSRNIIYMDIKPGNIMILDNSVKLMDFGISGFIHSKDKKIKGTLSYISPESLQGNTTFSTDIFSLGIVFFELLSGLRFYDNCRGSIGFIVGLLDSPDEFSLFLNERMNLINNQAIRNILKKMMAHKIDQRYNTCSEIIRDINIFLGSKYDYETNETKFSYVLGNSFANREKEIENLKARTKEHKDIKMLVYSGLAGVGKTRLFLEFKKYCRLNNIPFFESSCIEGETQSYKSVCDILSQLIIFSSESLLNVYGKYLKLVLPEDNRLQGFSAPGIFDNPELMKNVIVQNITDYIIEFSSEQKKTIIIYFNDLQWIDSGSELILKNMINRLDIIEKEDRKLLFYANINLNKLDKDGSILEVLSLAGIERYELQALDINGINEYIGNVFGFSYIDESLKSSILHIKERIGGNPLFLEELIRSLLDRNIIIKDIEWWKLLNPIQDIEIPDNIIDIAKNRLSKLFADPYKRRILRILSMLRIALTINPIKTIIDKICTVDTAKVLLELENLEIIHCTNIENKLYYSYTSSLIKDLVRSGIQNKAEISLFLAKTLESMSGSKTEEYIEEIAYHYKNGNDIKKSIYYYERAGNKAMKNYFNNKALTHFEAILSLMHKNKIYDTEKILSIKIKIASILYLQGKWDESGQIYKDCIELSKAIKNKRLLSESNIGYGKIKLFMGDAQEALKIFYESSRLSQDIGDMQGLQKALRQIGTAYSKLSKYHEALKYYERCEKIAYETGNRKEAGKTAQSIGNIYFSLNQYKKALKYFHISRNIARQSGDKLEFGRASGDIGNVYLSLGEYHKALKFYAINSKISQDIGDKKGMGNSIGNEGVTYYSLGQYQKAMECNLVSKKIAQEIGYKHGIARSLGNIGNIYMSRKEYSKALNNYGSSRKISEEIGDKWGIGVSTGNMGLIYDQLERYDEALECFQKSRDIAQEIGFKHGYGVSTGSMGGIYLSMGEFQKALECYRIKKDIAVELGDKRGISTAEANMGLIYQSMGTFNKARECFDKYMTISRDIDNKTGIRTALSNISELCVDMGDYIKAYEFIEKAVQMDCKLEGTREEYLELVITKSYILRKLERLKEAGTVINEALELAIQLDNPDCLIRARIQSHIIDSKDNRASSVKSLLQMLATDMKEEYRASIYYELYLIEKNYDYITKALDLYGSLYKKIPKYQYKKRIEELKRSSDTNLSIKIRQVFRPAGL